MNATIIGSLAAAVLLFLSTILVPFITRKANKTEEASQSALRSAETAERYTNSAIALVGGVEKQLIDANKKCDRCLDELGKLKRRDDKRDRALDAIHSALLEIVPLLDADADATRMLRAAVRTVQQARYED